MMWEWCRRQHNMTFKLCSEDNPALDTAFDDCDITRAKMVGSQLASAPCNSSSAPAELIYIISHTKLFFFLQVEFQVTILPGSILLRPTRLINYILFLWFHNTGITASKELSVQCLFSFNLMNYKKGILNTHLSILSDVGYIAYPGQIWFFFLTPCHHWFFVSIASNGCHVKRGREEII